MSLLINALISWNMFIFKPIIVAGVMVNIGFTC
jgi:hypothetical protein